MVSVYACYEDGKDINIPHITKITYAGYDKKVDVSEENLSTHCFPIGKPLWLYSNDGISVINGTGLRLVEVRNE